MLPILYASVSNQEKKTKVDDNVLTILNDLYASDSSTSNPTQAKAKESAAVRNIMNGDSSPLDNVHRRSCVHAGRVVI